MCSMANCGFVTTTKVPDDEEREYKMQLMQLQMQELQIHGTTVHPCEYNTDSQVPADTDFNIKFQLLQIHEAGVHNGGGGQVRTHGSKAKMDTTTIKELKIHWKKQFVTRYRQSTARKEQVKMERETVSHENDDVSAVTSSASQQGIPTTCRHCTGKSHGPATFKTRKTLCPAFNHQCEKCKVKGHYQQTCFKCSDCGSWGHSNKKSKWCKKGDKQQKAEGEVASMLSAMSMSFIGQEVGVLNSVADLRLTLRNRKFLRKRTPLRRHVSPVRQEFPKSVLPPVMPDPVCTPSPPASETRESHQAPPVNSYPVSTTSLPVSSYQNPNVDSCPTSVPAQDGDLNVDTVPSYTPTSPSTPVRQLSPAPQFTPVQQMQTTHISSPPATPFAPGTAPGPCTPGSQRPQRARKPNSMYSEADWELGAIGGQNSLPLGQMTDMLCFVANKLGYVPRSQP